MTTEGGRWGQWCLSESVAEVVSGLQRLTTSRSKRTRQPLRLSVNDHLLAIAKEVATRRGPADEIPESFSSSAASWRGFGLWQLGGLGTVFRPATCLSDERQRDRLHSWRDRGQPVNPARDSYDASGVRCPLRS